MEVITIENRAYQDLMLKLEQLIHSFSEKPKVEKDDEKKDEWLDSAAVCQQLNISSRTLHRMQKERLISYSILRGRYRFKQSDVEQFLHDRVVVSNPEALNEQRQTYPAYQSHKK
jgi:excisionase family DNA binding protein